MMGEHHWTTKITKVESNRIYVRGHRIDKLMGKITFSEAIYLLLKAELPDEKRGKMLEAILVSSVDHGATPPSTLVARTIASTGNPIHTALAGGILTIYKWHGGAIENAMRQYLAVVKRSEETGEEIQETARKYVEEKLSEKERLFGFGHRIHKKDPRTKRLFDIARETGLFGKYVQAALGIEEAIREVKGKELPINVDGAIAAILCEMDFPPELGNTFFIMSRTPGLVAHIHEEITRERPMRIIDPVDHEYVGEIHDEE